MSQREVDDVNRRDLGDKAQRDLDDLVQRDLDNLVQRDLDNLAQRDLDDWAQLRFYYTAALLWGPLQFLREQELGLENFWARLPMRESLMSLLDKGKEDPVLGQLLAWADGEEVPRPPALESPFSLLTGFGEDESKWIQPVPLAMDRPVFYPTAAGALFSQSHRPFKGWGKQVKKTGYHQLARAFLREWEELARNRGDDFEPVILPLLEKYFSSVPAGLPGVTVYEQSRIAAALAACWFSPADHKREGDVDALGTEVLQDASGAKSVPMQLGANTPVALLVKGDLSGIQDFIFRIHSEGASKALKARSAHILHLAEIMVQRLVDRLQLLPAQVIYQGGGNFHLLVSPEQESALQAEFHAILRDLLEQELQFHLAWTALKAEDFQAIGAAWSRVDQHLQAQRLRPLAGTDFEEAFPRAVAPIQADNEDWRQRTNQAQGTIGFRGSSQDGEAIAQLGSASLTLLKIPHAQGIAYNRIELEAGWQGFRSIATQLPRWEVEELQVYEAWERSQGLPAPEVPRKARDILDFQALAGISAQEGHSRHLGVLKMDVDSLGKLFKERLVRPFNSLTRTLAISRILNWFFASYLEQLVREAPYQGRIYLIFAGGDDLFLAGPWHLTFQFAGKVREEFAQLVGSKKGLTLSGGLLLLGPHYPVQRFADRAERALELSKQGEKDQITLFGECLSWADFRAAQALKDTIVDLIVKRKVSRKVLQTLRYSATGFAVRHREANTPQLHLPRIWRLRHFLRDSALGKDKAQKAAHARDIEALLIRPYEELVGEVFTSSARGPAPGRLVRFAVAARWAEFTLRNQKYES